MEYCLETVKKKVSIYLDGSLDKEALGKWGKSAYYDLLRGGYLKNIVLLEKNACIML